MGKQSSKASRQGTDADRIFIKYNQGIEILFSCFNEQEFYMV